MANRIFQDFIFLEQIKEKEILILKKEKVKDVTDDLRKKYFDKIDLEFLTKMKNLYNDNNNIYYKIFNALLKSNKGLILVINSFSEYINKANLNLIKEFTQLKDKSDDEVNNFLLELKGRAVSARGQTFYLNIIQIKAFKDFIKQLNVLGEVDLLLSSLEKKSYILDKNKIFFTKETLQNSINSIKHKDYDSSNSAFKALYETFFITTNLLIKWIELIKNEKQNRSNGQLDLGENYLQKYKENFDQDDWNLLKNVLQKTHKNLFTAIIDLVKNDVILDDKSFVRSADMGYVFRLLNTYKQEIKKYFLNFNDLQDWNQYYRELALTDLSESDCSDFLNTLIVLFESIFVPDKIQPKKYSKQDMVGFILNKKPQNLSELTSFKTMFEEMKKELIFIARGLGGNEDLFLDYIKTAVNFKASFHVFDLRINDSKADDYTKLNTLFYVVFKDFDFTIIPRKFIDNNIIDNLKNNNNEPNEFNKCLLGVFRSIIEALDNKRKEVQKK